jgi:magnesium-transporting ATPase (P-type)
MSDLQKIEQEKSVLRWGGLAGILGAIVFILVFVIVIVFVGLDPAELEVVRFPDIRAVRTVENSLYLVTLMLWVTHFLALYRALRGTSLAPALFGSGLGLLGLVVLAAGALPHVAFAPLSDLYHAPGATPEEQATLVLLSHATQGIFDELFIVGLVLLPIGLIALGVAMLGTPAFEKRFGGVSLALGVAGVVAASVLLVDPLSPIGIVGVFALIVFHLVLGWKVYSLSRAT